MSQQTVYNYTRSSQIKDYLIFKDISILIYGNIIINELSLIQRAVSNFRDKSDPPGTRGATRQFWDCPGHSGTVGNPNCGVDLKKSSRFIQQKIPFFVAEILTKIKKVLAPIFPKIPNLGFPQRNQKGFSQIP